MEHPKFKLSDYGGNYTLMMKAKADYYEERCLAMERTIEGILREYFISKNNWEKMILVKNEKG